MSSSFHQYNTRSRQYNNLSEYQIGKKLGEGAFAKVYAALHIPSQTPRAIKVVKLTKLEEKYEKMCINEVTLLKKINSQNVVKCFDAFMSDKETLNIVLEFVDGGDLATRIHVMRDRGMIFAERTIWFIFHQLCAGVRDLHAKKILHRDLKPANVFVSSLFKVKVADLGLSRSIIANKAAMTQVGTEYYKAPERTTYGGYHFQSDIWSLGCLLYEMCTYKSPFNGEQINQYSLHKKIKYGEIVPFPMDVYSEPLLHFTYSCLSTNPDERPDASECYDAARLMYEKFEILLLQYRKANNVSSSNQ